MKQKCNKFLDKLGMLLLIITIVTFNLIIGANDKGLRVLPISILMGLILIYLFVLKIYNVFGDTLDCGKKCQSTNKSIFLKSKIDYLVLAFMITTTLPFIFRTYASYSDNIEFIMKYYFIYFVYVLARNVLKDKKSVELTITVTIVSSLIPALLSLDILYGHWFNDFIKWLNLDYVESESFHGPFGYANTMAIYMAFCVFLTMHKFEIHNKKLLKILDIIYILFAIVIIILTKALAVELLLGISLFALLIAKYRKQIKKNIKKIVIIIGSLILVISTFFTITLNKTKPVIGDEEDINEQIIYNFKKDQTYTLEMNIKTEETDNSKHNRIKVFEIEILEYGKYFKELTIKKQYSGAVEGYYKIDFTPTQDTRYIRIKINNLFHGKITIDDFFINGERQVVKFKYYPFYMGKFLSQLYMPGKSIPERLYMYKDCLKIAQKNLLIGNGGNAWEVLSRSVAEYEGAFKECHSYFFELLISYGIVGLLVFLTLIIYFFIKIFKQCKKEQSKRNEKLLIAIGLLLVLLHSMIDFNMSFMIIQLVFYIYIALLQYDEQEKIKKYKILDYFSIIFLMFIFSLYVREDISKYIVQDNSQKYLVTSFNKNYYQERIKQEYKENNGNVELLKELQNFIKKEPYNWEQTENYEKYFNIFYKNIERFSTNEFKKYLLFLVDSIENVPYRVPFAFEPAIYRVNMLNRFMEKLESYKKIEPNVEKLEILNNLIQRLKVVILKENETNSRNMEDYNKHHYKEYEIEKMLLQFPKLKDI